MLKTLLSEQTEIKAAGTNSVTETPVSVFSAEEV